MKKIFILIIILFSGFFWLNYVNASDHVKVTTNSEMPWVDCEKIWATKYECKVPKKSDSLIKTFWWIIKYFAFLTGIFWVLFIVINWIMYSMGWLDQELKETAKKRIIQTIFWLVILFSSGYILQTLAPWFFK